MPGSRNRQIGLDSEQIGESAALLTGKQAAKTVRLHDRLSLRLRHLAEIAKGAGNEAAAILRQTAKLLHGSADLLPLCQSQSLHRFGSINYSAALFRRHIMKLSQPIEHALLGFRRKFMKARFIF